jgi:hypothetical protein
MKDHKSPVYKTFKLTSYYEHVYKTNKNMQSLTQIWIISLAIGYIIIIDYW